MSADEQAILDYLKTTPGSFVSRREISRRVGGRQREEEDRLWAVPVLRGMVSKGWLEVDAMGHFRIPIPEDAKQKRKKRHLSPHMRRLLEQSGRSFD